MLRELLEANQHRNVCLDYIIIKFSSAAVLLCLKKLQALHAISDSMCRDHMGV